MTIVEEGRQIRSEVSKLRPDKRRRYPAGLKGRILDWFARATASEMPESDAAKLLGIKTWRITTWRHQEVPKSLALARIEVPPIEVGNAGLTVVTPSGHRI